MAEKFFEDARVVVTGASGTVGSELLRQLIELPVTEVRALDNNEESLFYLSEIYRGDRRFHYFLTDVGDKDELHRAFESADIVIHAAALKNVPVCERSPFATVQTNIHGVQNVILAARQCGVSKVLFTSSDKAVNPTNVMGTTKLMGERLITAANATKDGTCETTYFSTRFGNVTGSRGSVIPLFTRQIREGGPVTLTDADMTRFIMTLGESVQLLLESLQMACGGEVFVTKMPVLRIADLAEVMVQELAPLFGHRPQDVETQIIGARPGEKLFEELMNSEEVARSVELGDFFSILPAFRNIYDGVTYQYKGQTSEFVDDPYISSTRTPMSVEAIKELLLKPAVLEDNVRAALQARREKNRTLSAVPSALASHAS